MKTCRLLALGAILASLASPLAAFHEPGLSFDGGFGTGNLGGFSGTVDYYAPQSPWGFFATFDALDMDDNFSPGGAGESSTWDRIEIGGAYMWENGLELAASWWSTQLQVENVSTTDLEDDGFALKLIYGQHFGGEMPGKGEGWWKIAAGALFYEGDTTNYPGEKRDGECFTLNAQLRFPLGASFSAYGKYDLGCQGGDYGNLADTESDILPQRYEFGVSYPVSEGWRFYAGWEHILWGFGNDWAWDFDEGTDGLKLGVTFDSSQVLF